MKKYAVIVALVLIASAFQCSNNLQSSLQDEFVVVTYAETQCADPWQRGERDLETLRNIENFLRAEGIRFYGIRIVAASEGLITCLACNCGTGRRIEGKVHKDDLEAIKRYGFTLQKP